MAVSGKVAGPTWIGGNTFESTVAVKSADCCCMGSRVRRMPWVSKCMLTSQGNAAGCESMEVRVIDSSLLFLFEWSQESSESIGLLVE